MSRLQAATLAPVLGGRLSASMSTTRFLRRRAMTPWATSCLTSNEMSFLPFITSDLSLRLFGVAGQLAWLVYTNLGIFGPI